MDGSSGCVGSLILAVFGGFNRGRRQLVSVGGVGLNSRDFSSFLLRSLDNIFNGFLLLVALGFNVIGIFVKEGSGFNLAGLSINRRSVSSSVSIGGKGRGGICGGCIVNGSTGVAEIAAAILSNSFSAHSQNSLDSSIKVIIVVVGGFNDGGLGGVGGSCVSSRSFVGFF